MISETKPNAFEPRFEVVSCFCECDGQILLLRRQPHKPQGNTWGVPAGKLEQGESPLEAVTREILEECGLDVEESRIRYFKTVFVRYPDTDFIYHIFHTSFWVKPYVHIRENEHSEYKWVSPQRALEMNLIPDMDECIRLSFPVA